MRHLGLLEEFLAAHHPRAHEDGRWGTIRFHLASYLCERLPPLDLITSVRAVRVLRGQIMVVRDPGSVHILPGGRRHEGESLEETLRRELSEETGWTIDQPHLLGIRHFHQHGPHTGRASVAGLLPDCVGRQRPRLPP